MNKISPRYLLGATTGLAPAEGTKQQSIWKAKATCFAAQDGLSLPDWLDKPHPRNQGVTVCVGFRYASAPGSSLLQTPRDRHLKHNSIQDRRKSGSKQIAKIPRCNSKRRAFICRQKVLLFWRETLNQSQLVSLTSVSLHVFGELMGLHLATAPFGRLTE
jgi:hypothetical protein